MTKLDFTTLSTVRGGGGTAQASTSGIAINGNGNTVYQNSGNSSQSSSNSSKKS